MPCIPLVAATSSLLNGGPLDSDGAIGLPAVVFSSPAGAGLSGFIGGEAPRSCNSLLTLHGLVWFSAGFQLLFFGSWGLEKAQTVGCL